MPGGSKGSRVLFRSRVEAAGIRGRRFLHRNGVKACALDRVSEVGPGVPTVGAAGKDDTRDLVGVGEAAAAAIGLDRQSRYAADVGLFGRHPERVALHDDGIRTRPGKGNAVEFGDAGRVADYVGRKRDIGDAAAATSQSNVAFHQLGPADRQRIDGAQTHIHIMVGR